MDLAEALNILCKARNNLSHADYVKIWGEHLGDHIWRQEGNDLLRLWKSGLTTEEKDAFIRYIQEEL